jgi:hypothetical protein
MWLLGCERRRVFRERPLSGKGTQREITKACAGSLQPVKAGEVGEWSGGERDSRCGDERSLVEKAEEWGQKNQSWCGREAGNRELADDTVKSVVDS